MLKYLFLLVALVGVSEAKFIFGGVSFEDIPLMKSSLSVSNGGDIPDSEVLNDGVGLQIISGFNAKKVNFSPMNKAYKKFSTEASENGMSISEFLHKPDMFAHKDFGDKKPPASDCYQMPIGSNINGYTVVDNGLLNSFINSKSNLSKVCTSNITNMSGLFSSSSAVGDISGWDTSHVVNMSAMFKKKWFNQDLSNWDVSNVKNMDYMFAYNPAFNNSLAKWDTANLISARHMFEQSVFNNDVSSLVHGQNISLYAIFAGDKKFNHASVNEWDMKNVTNLDFIFSSAIAFNKPLNKWNISKVNSMKGIFSGNNVAVFNQDISMWDTSHVSNMDGFLQENRVFNGNLSNWNVSNVSSHAYFDYLSTHWDNENKPKF